MQDEKDNKFDLRAKQILIGPGVGFVAFLIFSSLNTMDLYGDIMYSMIVGFFTMIATIIIVTYLHNRHREREKRPNHNK
jgi:hypothetical protein